MRTKNKNSDFSPLNMDVLDSFLDSDQDSELNGTQIKWISLNKLTPAKWQPRRFFDPQKISELAASFQQHGFKGSVNVRPLEQGDYEIIAGERRYRAAKAAGIEEIACIIANYSDEQALEFSLVENLVREDLSKLEETEGVLDFISLKLKLSRDEAITIIRTEGHPDRLTRNNVAPDSSLGKICSILDNLGMSIEAFRSRNLLLLKLPEDLREAHLSGRLSYTKAIEINKIKDDFKRKELLRQTLDNDWPIREIQQRVKEARAEKRITQTSVTRSILSRLAIARKIAAKSNVWQDQNKVERIESLLIEIEALFEEHIDERA